MKMASVGFHCFLLLFLFLFLPSLSRGLFFKRLFGPSRDLEQDCSGICQLCTSCWLGGGYVSGGCGGLYVCCKKQPLLVAEARKINFWSPEPLNNELAPLQEIQYGPVINDPRCGVPTISRRRVVGGSEAGFGRFPWQALIRVGGSRCGGALINKLHVITAGHCVHGTQPEEIRVALGEYALRKNTEPLAKQRFGVERVFRHPYYRFTPQADRYDVAVLRLDRPVFYEPHISPICLPYKDQGFGEGTSAIVAGWGAMKANTKKRPDMLQAAEVNLVNSTKCERWHGQNEITVEIFEDMICAGHELGGRDACQGDSGGPLMTQVQDDLHADPEVLGLRVGQPKWVLIGLVSAGYSCAMPGQPGIYHKITKTADWISYVSRVQGF